MTTIDQQRLLLLSGLLKEGIDDWKEAPAGDTERVPSDSCPMCGARPGEPCDCVGSDDKPSDHPNVHHSNIPEDYETCSDCGYDHEYEPLEANGWHRQHGAPGTGITPADMLDPETKERKLRGEGIEESTEELDEMASPGSHPLYKQIEHLVDGWEAEQIQAGKNRVSVTKAANSLQSFILNAMEKFAGALQEGTENSDGTIKVSIKELRAVIQSVIEEGNWIEETAPPGWEGTVKAMKKHGDIDNPWALAWYMKKHGAKSHKKK